MNENKYSEIEVERVKARNKFLIFLLSGIAVLIIGAIIAFLTTISVFFIFIIIFAILMILAFSYKKNFDLKFKMTVISSLIKEELGADAKYNPTGGINLDSIMKHKMYESPDRWHMEDYIQSSYNDVEYSMCDARFEERHVRYDSKGNRHVDYDVYFSGRIICIQLNRDLNTRLKIVEGHPRGFNKQGMEKFETELIDFNKKYDTYVNDKEMAFYMLTPVMLQKLLELEKLFKGTIQYSFDDNNFMIFINNSGNSLEISLNKKLDEKNLEIYRGQIRLAATIINEFKLDSDKFQKELEN